MNLITISLKDETKEINIDLSQGLPPNTKIHDLEKMESVVYDDSIIEIVEDVELDDLMEIVQIPENERLYSKKEEFNDMFEQLINKDKSENINFVLEEKIKKSIEFFFELKNKTTEYCEKTGKINRIPSKKKGFKPACQELINNNFDNTSYIPIISDKNKLFVVFDEDIELEDSHQTNFNKEMIEIKNLYEKYVNADFSDSNDDFTYYKKKLQEIEEPYKMKDNFGHKHILKKDTIVFRNCFENGCSYINEKEDESQKKKNSERKALSEINRSKETIIEVDGENKTEKMNIFNPETINIVGYVSIPNNLYNNKNIYNVSNVKELCDNKKSLIILLLEES
jgi:hypothetical protein